MEDLCAHFSHSFGVRFTALGEAAPLPGIINHVFSAISPETVLILVFYTYGLSLLQIWWD
jgi:hypothetical protein